MEHHPLIFGEVLFDCFPDGSEVPGGAPFNVAWNLQAFHQQPYFISRVGNDRQGDQIRSLMRSWSMHSDFLQLDCRLVYLPDDQVRQVDPKYANPGEQVGFADGFPFLLISQASLDDLNARLDNPVPMQRFRPNLVVDGCSAYAEDAWRRIRIGDIEFRVAKPCSRCIIPTIDPLTATRADEPLRTLMGYRRWDNNVWFGQNLLHDTPGVLAEGMQVEVLE